MPEGAYSAPWTTASPASNKRPDRGLPEISKESSCQNKPRPQKSNHRCAEAARQRTSIAIASSWSERSELRELGTDKRHPASRDDKDSATFARSRWAFVFGVQPRFHLVGPAFSPPCAPRVLVLSSLLVVPCISKKAPPTKAVHTRAQTYVDPSAAEFPRTFPDSAEERQLSQCLMPPQS